MEQSHCNGLWSILQNGFEFTFTLVNSCACGGFEKKLGCQKRVTCQPDPDPPPFDAYAIFELHFPINTCIKAKSEN